MKLTSALAFVFATAASAKSLLAVFPDEINVGESYVVEWLTDRVEILELKLVHKESHGWKRVTNIFDGKHTEPMGGNYTWTVDQSTPTGEGYGLWLSASYPNSNAGYADLTRWFKISPAKDGKEDLK